MNAASRQRTLEVCVENFEYIKPFRISGYTFSELPVVVVTLREGGFEGRGEASGIYYLGETATKMAAEIEATRAAIEAGVSRSELQALMPAGGARNAVDCALWELDARRAGVPVWQLAGLNAPRALLTTFTLGADDPAVMALGAKAYAQARALKLKLTGDIELDAERVRAVRAARADVWIGVDANQGLTPDSLDWLFPTLLDEGVSLVEQPFARGREADLDGYNRRIRFAADESVLTLGDVEGLVGRFDVVNIKLDKCGGLTEGLAMAAEARRVGLDVMVGNMAGSSWQMAPGFVLGQLCDIVDLDGPIFLKTDRTPSITYENGLVCSPDEVWGGRA